MVKLAEYHKEVDFDIFLYNLASQFDMNYAK